MVPQWGFASSPLVAHGLVTVYAGAPNGKSVVAYQADSGKPAWSSGEGQFSYCSPQLSTLDGVEQILITTDAGLTAFQPKSGEVLWKHSWQLKDQPRRHAADGARRQRCAARHRHGRRHTRAPCHTLRRRLDGERRWLSKALKPYFNDGVVYDNYLYGFDSGMFICLSLEDGKGHWREPGYGSGQVLLLADQGLLLVVAETGEVGAGEG